MKRRLLSMLLVLAMLLSMAPVGVFAEETPAEEAKTSAAQGNAILSVNADYDEDLDQISVKVSYQLLEGQEVNLVVAAYDSNRMHMLDSQYENVYCGCDAVYESNFTFYGLPQWTTFRVFMLDAETNEPLTDWVFSYVNGKHEDLSGMQGELEWALEGGTLRITAPEDAEDTELKPSKEGLRDYAWEEYMDEITYVDFYGVTAVAEGAFAEYPALNRVDFNAASELTIHDRAFYNCANLEEVHVYAPQVQSIGQQAFDGCVRLSEVPGLLEECGKIDDYAFNGCLSLEGSLYIYASEMGYGVFANSGVKRVDFTRSTITEIHGSTFENCQNLEELSLPDSGVAIDSYAFAGAYLAYVGGNSYVNLTNATKIMGLAFAGATIEYLYLDGTDNLGMNSFAGAQLDEVHVNAEEIPEGAFKDTWIGSIQLDGVQTIRSEAFACAHVNEMYDPYSYLQTVEANAFRDCGLDYLEVGWDGWDYMDIALEGNQEFGEAWLEMRNRWRNPGDDDDYDDYDDYDEDVEVEQTEEVPEQVEEVPEQAAEPAEELTAEEAAQEGYYVAPEGAQMVEQADLEEMAAYTGTDKLEKGYHNVTFTGLVPRQNYVLIVSTEPGSVEPEKLQYINAGYADENGEVEAVYSPRTEEPAIVQLYGPEKLELKPSRECITMRGTSVYSFTLNPTVKNAYVWIEGAEEGQFNNAQCWILRDSNGEQGVFIWTDNNGMWYAVPDGFHMGGTFYADFCASTGSQFATTRIRFDLLPGVEVKGAILGETNVTRNVYDENATELPVFLQTENKQQPEETEAKVGIPMDFDEEMTAFIDKAEFSKDSAEAAKYFAVSVKNDHTLLLTTRKDAPISSLKKNQKFTVKFDLTIKGDKYEGFEEKGVVTTNAMTLTAQQELPKIKASAVALNPYAVIRSGVTYTGGEVEGIVGSVDCGKTPIAYDSDKGEFYVDFASTAAMKAASLNIKTQVKVKGYTAPVAVTIPVKLTVKAPTLKLSEKSVTFKGCYGMYVSSLWLNGDTDGLVFEETVEVYDSKGNILPGYEAEFCDEHPEEILLTTLESEFRPSGNTSAKLRLHAVPAGSNVEASQGMTIDLPLTIKNETPKVKLGKSSVTTNVDYEGWFFVSADVQNADYGYFDVDPYWTVSAVKGVKPDSGKTAKDFFRLEVRTPENGVEYGYEILPVFSMDDFVSEDAYNKAINASYTLNIGFCSNPTAKLTVKLTSKVPSVKIKAVGTLNPDNQAGVLNITETFTNAAKMWPESWTIIPVGQTEETKDLELCSTDTGMGVKAADGKTPAAGKYTLTVVYADKLKASTTFEVKAAKRTLKVTGKLDNFDMDTAAVLAPSVTRRDEEGWVLCPEVVLKDAAKKEITREDGVFDYLCDDEGVILLHPLVKNGKMLPAGKYTVELKYYKEYFGEDFTLTGTVQVTEPKLKVTAKGTLNSYQPDNEVELTTNFAKYQIVADEEEQTFMAIEPTVTVEGTAKNGTKLVLDEDYRVVVNTFDSSVSLYPLENEDRVIPAGSYKVTLDYGKWNGKQVTASVVIKAAQTPEKLTANAKSVTIHPNVKEPVQVYVYSSGYNPDAQWGVTVCDAKGKPVQSEYLRAEISHDEDNWGFVKMVGTGKAPKADTTLKLKLMADTRTESSVTWLTVKVLGQKNAKTANLSLKTSQKLDPSYFANSINISASLKNFAAQTLYPDMTLEASKDGKNYEPVSGRTTGNEVYENQYLTDAWYDNGNLDLNLVTGADMIKNDGTKYRVHVKVYGDRARTALVAEGTCNLKVAIGSNKFTLDGAAPTFYKSDKGQQVKFAIAQKDSSQSIEKLVIKNAAKSNFELCGDKTLRVKSGVDSSKLKSEKLTLEIYLKNGKGTKPDATMTLPVNVK